jgi:hypothetical protein
MTASTVKQISTCNRNPLPQCRLSGEFPEDLLPEFNLHLIFPVNQSAEL